MNRIFALLVALQLTVASWGQCTRSQAISDYNNIYLASAVTDTQLGWTGNLGSCIAGTISSLSQANTLNRVNYFRKLVGLGNVTFDAVLSGKCQQAALMMAANNSLNHTPPPSWLCYTSDGAAAAGSSNLALGVHSASAITLYMNDYGLTSVGHRRWILYSRASVFGHGSALKSDALQVFNAPVGVVNTKNIAFPSAGFFPAPLVPVLWSFGKHNANFAGATVTMTGPSGAPVSLSVAAIQNGFGDNTIVWTPSGIVTNSTYDVDYTVHIGNVIVDGTPQTYSYTVTICQPIHPPQCTAGKTWSETYCACTTVTGVEEADEDELSMAIRNPFSEFLEIKVTDKSNNESQLSVIDYTGRTVIESPVCIGSGENTFSFNSSGWQKGIYFVILKDRNGKKYVRKVIRQ
jgi:uncharacterized protein YkwD